MWTVTFLGKVEVFDPNPMLSPVMNTVCMRSPLLLGKSRQ